MRGIAEFWARKGGDAAGPDDPHLINISSRDHVPIDDLAELAARVLASRSQDVLNVAVHSFRSVAEQVMAAVSNKVAVSRRPRQGPMPHYGYRPFAPAAVKLAFPDFAFTPLAAGLGQAQAQAAG
jgi:UDP-glucose 4-epimerase